MDELIQTTTGLKLDLDRSIVWDLEDGSRITEMVKVTTMTIFDASMLSLYCSFPIVIQRHKFASTRNG